MSERVSSVMKQRSVRGWMAEGGLRDAKGRRVAP
jgi:hypothetical protein